MFVVLACGVLCFCARMMETSTRSKITACYSFLSQIMSGLNSNDDTMTHHVDCKNTSQLFTLLNYVWNHSDPIAASYLGNCYKSGDYVEKYMNNLGFSFVHDMKGGHPNSFQLLEPTLPQDYIRKDKHRLNQIHYRIEINVASQIQQILCSLFVKTVEEFKQAMESETKCNDTIGTTTRNPGATMTDSQSIAFIDIDAMASESKSNDTIGATTRNPGATMTDSQLIAFIDQTISYLKTTTLVNQKYQVPFRLIQNKKDIHPTIINNFIQSFISQCVSRLPQQVKDTANLHHVPSHWWQPVSACISPEASNLVDFLVKLLLSLKQMVMTKSQLSCKDAIQLLEFFSRRCFCEYIKGVAVEYVRLSFQLQLLLDDMISEDLMKGCWMVNVIVPEDDFKLSVQMFEALFPLIFEHCNSNQILHFCSNNAPFVEDKIGLIESVIGDECELDKVLMLMGLLGELTVRVNHVLLCLLYGFYEKSAQAFSQLMIMLFDDAVVSPSTPHELLVNEETKLRLHDASPTPSLKPRWTVEKVKPKPTQQSKFWMLNFQSCVDARKFYRQQSNNGKRLGQWIVESFDSKSDKNSTPGLSKTTKLLLLISCIHIAIKMNFKLYCTQQRPEMALIAQLQQQFSRHKPRIFGNIIQQINKQKSAHHAFILRVCQLLVTYESPITLTHETMKQLKLVNSQPHPHFNVFKLLIDEGEVNVADDEIIQSVQRQMQLQSQIQQFDEGEGKYKFFWSDNVIQWIQPTNSVPTKFESCMINVFEDETSSHQSTDAFALPSVKLLNMACLLESQPSLRSFIICCCEYQHDGDKTQHNVWNITNYSPKWRINAQLYNQQMYESGTDNLEESLLVFDGSLTNIPVGGQDLLATQKCILNIGICGIDYLPGGCLRIMCNDYVLKCPFVSTKSGIIVDLTRNTTFASCIENGRSLNWLSLLKICDVSPLAQAVLFGTESLALYWCTTDDWNSVVACQRKHLEDYMRELFYVFFGVDFKEYCCDCGKFAFCTVLASEIQLKFENPHLQFADVSVAQVLFDKHQLEKDQQNCKFVVIKVNEVTETSSVVDGFEHLVTLSKHSAFKWFTVDIHTIKSVSSLHLLIVVKSKSKKNTGMFSSCFVDRLSVLVVAQCVPFCLFVLCTPVCCIFCDVIFSFCSNKTIN